MNRHTSATSMRRKAVWGSGARLLGVALGALLSTSCGTTTSGTGSSYLVLTSLQGGAGLSGTLSSVLQSDVLNVNAQTGATSIAPDRGEATFQLNMKDPSLTPSPNNAITLTQYHVDYIRSDGHNTEGVDVPFAFDGAVTLTITGTGSADFTLVRIQAKQEAPLEALARGGGQNTISTIAQVTFYGHDQTGRGVTVTGNIEVDFSDWAG